MSDSPMNPQATSAETDDLILNQEEPESTCIGQEEAGSSGEPAVIDKVEKSEEAKGPQYFDFKCALCAFSVRARYGPFSHGIVGYKHDVYYLKSLNYQAEQSKISKRNDYRKFAVIGAKCYSCSRDVCSRVQCSFFYEQNYCVDCIFTKRREFPQKIIEHIVKRKNNESTEKK